MWDVNSPLIHPARQYTALSDVAFAPNSVTQPTELQPMSIGFFTAPDNIMTNIPGNAAPTLDLWDMITGAPGILDLYSNPQSQYNGSRR